jgi:hypothetical protein
VAQDRTVKAEAWLIERAGHYWSGGDRGEATPRRPQRLTEMLRPCCLASVKIGPANSFCFPPNEELGGFSGRIRCISSRQTP